MELSRIECVPNATGIVFPSQKGSGIGFGAITSNSALGNTAAVFLNVYISYPLKFYHRCSDCFSGDYVSKIRYGTRCGIHALPWRKHNLAADYLVFGAVHSESRPGRRIRRIANQNFCQAGTWPQLRFCSRAFICQEKSAAAAKDKRGTTFFFLIYCSLTLLRGMNSFFAFFANFARNNNS